MRARIPALYETALDDLSALAEGQVYGGAAGFRAWQRLEVLVVRLRALYDAYELEGDVGAVRREIEAYEEDLHASQCRPERAVITRLARLLADLEADAPVISIQTSAVPTAIPAWPDHYLTLGPTELERLLARDPSHKPT